MRRPVLVLLFACWLLAATCVPASATDATVEQAWHGDDAQFTKVGKQFSRGVRIWVKSGNRKPGRALRANRKTQRLLKGTRRRVRAEASSSATGERAKKLALASMSDFAKELKLQAATIRRITAGKSPTRLLKRTDKVAARSRKRSKRARKLFRQAEREAAAPTA